MPSQPVVVYSGSNNDALMRFFLSKSTTISSKNSSPCDLYKLKLQNLLSKSRTPSRNPMQIDIEELQSIMHTPHPLKQQFFLQPPQPEQQELFLPPQQPHTSKFAHIRNLNRTFYSSSVSYVYF